MAAVDPSIFEYINLTSTDGKNTINIAGGVVSLSFFENLFSPHLSASFLVVNTGSVVNDKSVYQGLPLRGGERVDMKIVNDSGPDLEFTEKLKKSFPEIGVISDIALDPYTSHGQDGFVNTDGKIDNDKTIHLLCKQALVHAHAGADILAPSDMRNVVEKARAVGNPNILVCERGVSFGYNN